MTDIFISYSRNDAATARRFADALEAAGHRVWWDDALRSGDAFDEKIEQALRGAKAVVVLWSKTSVTSRWVRAEATLADRNKVLVPVMIEPCERPIIFELTHTAELSHWKGDTGDKAWLGFVADIQKLVKKKRAKPPVPKAAPAPEPTLNDIAAEPPPKPETLLAVLPFDNLSSDADMSFFSDGVSEEILGRITRGSKLKVIGRTSSFQFRGADKPKAAEALKATHVLDGSIRRAGAQVRVSANLTEAATGASLWSDKYDRGLDDIFAVQDEIAEAISEALNTTFFPPQTATIDPAVYDLYLRAKNPTPDPDKMREDVLTLTSVTQLAPSFADAWGMLITKRGLLSLNTPYAERPALRAAIDSDAARLAALDPQHPALSFVRFMKVDPFGAYLEQEKSLPAEAASNNTNDLFGRAWFLCTVGRNREATIFSRRAADMDSLNSIAMGNKGQTLWRAGEYAEGRAVMEHAVAQWPEDHHTTAALIQACAVQSDWEAVTRLTDPTRLSKYPLREHTGILGWLAVMREPTPENRQRLLDAVARRSETTGHLEPLAATAAAEFGFVDETYELIDRSKFGPSGGPRDILGINAYRTHLIFPKAFPALRNDPRFVKLAARLGLVEYWLTTQHWPDCAEETPYDFRAECEKHRDTPKDRFGL